MKRTGKNSSCRMRSGLMWALGALVFGGVILGLSGGAGAQAQRAPQVYVFEPLPYAYDALEPHIDARTMEIHYDRHHRAYHANLLRAADGAAWAGMPLEEIFPRMSRFPEAVRNTGGGHYNHTLFWEVMSPDGGGPPPPGLAGRINRDFGSFEAFKEQFTQAALTQFGSGWAWLCVDGDGILFVTSTPNQDNPLMDVADRQGVPILTLDVWEHAYYLNYQNRRGAYIDAFWNVVNWPRVVELLRASGR